MALLQARVAPLPSHEGMSVEMTVHTPCSPNNSHLPPGFAFPCTPAFISFRFGGDSGPWKISRQAFRLLQCQGLPVGSSADIVQRIQAESISYMSGEAERGTRFARDLRRIRRDRGVSLADIHDATKMAYDMIKRFEHDALIGHSQFSKVYLRLFVRGYAEYLNMDVEMALEAFELAMKGRYTGSLAQAYLGEPEEEHQEESPKQKKKTGRKEPAAPGPDQVTEATSSEQTGQESAKIPHEESAEPTRQTDSGVADSGVADSEVPDSEVPDSEVADSEVTDSEVTDSGVADSGAIDSGASDSGAPDSGATVSAASSTEQPAAREAPLAKTSAAREISSPKAPFTRRTSAGTSSKASSKTSPKANPSTGADAQAPAGSRPDPRWIFLGVLVVVIGLGVWGLTRVAPANDVTDATVPADGMTDAAIPANGMTDAAIPANGMADAAIPANGIPIQSLPDTLNIVIVADKGSVAPIRVTVDNDLRRPYWISRGGSMTFRMADRIILEQQLDSVTVQVEGMTYPVSRPTGEDMVTLTRDALRSWFSSIQR